MNLDVLNPLLSLEILYEPLYVKEQLGHNSIQMTVDIYGHLIPNSNREAVKRFDFSQPIRNQPKMKAGKSLITCPLLFLGAEEGTRTPTGVCLLDPEPSASTNSATSAIII